ncbi:hypothetical protein F5Y10DRAFT_258275 [Nemania abortiva]|nr:hypothetical protein F5Y10DRAFT_258275 [Nemania abortiva]
MSLGPLTTTYEPPHSCTSSFLTDFKPPGGWDVIGPLETTGDCFPPNYTDDGRKYYSPGICPAGYTAACADPAPGLGGGQTSVTTATCCPIGFTCISQPFELYGSTYACNSRIRNFRGTQIFISSGNTLSTKVTTISKEQDAIANAFGIQIQYRYEDFISTSSLTSSLISTTAPTPSSTSTITRPTNSKPGKKKNDQSGLSTAAAIGIGVGVGVGGLLLIAGVIWVICVRRFQAQKLHSPQEQGVNQTTGSAIQSSHMNMEQAWGKSISLSLYQSRVAELEQPIPELDHNHLLELELDSR